MGKRNIMGMTVIALLIVLSPVFSAAENGAPDPCFGVDLAWLSLHATLPNPELVEKKPQNGLCQMILKIQNTYVPVYAGKDFVIAGELYANKTAITRPVLAHYREMALKECLRELNTVTSVTYAPKNPNGKHVYMMTDPMCHFCNTAVEQIAAIADATGVTFNLVFSNVHEKEGEAKVREAICSNMDFAQYASSEWKKKEVKNITCEKADALIQKTVGIIEKYGLDGVPLFLLEDGQKMYGIEMEDLVKLIEKMNKGTVVAQGGVKPVPAKE